MFCQRDKKTWHSDTCSTVSDPICINVISDFHEVFWGVEMSFFEMLQISAKKVIKFFITRGVMEMQLQIWNKSNMKQTNMKGLCFIFIKLNTSDQWLQRCFGFHLYIFLCDEDVTGSEYITLTNYFVLCPAKKPQVACQAYI